MHARCADCADCDGACGCSTRSTTFCPIRRLTPSPNTQGRCVPPHARPYFKEVISMQSIPIASVFYPISGNNEFPAIGAVSLCSQSRKTVFQCAIERTADGESIT